MVSSRKSRLGQAQIVSFVFLVLFKDGGLLQQNHTEKDYSKFLINYIKLKLRVKLYRKKIHQTF